MAKKRNIPAVGPPACSSYIAGKISHVIGGYSGG